MKNVNEIAQDIQQEADELARLFDYSRTDAHTLVGEHLRTYEQLELLKREIFDWAIRALHDPLIRDNPERLLHCVEIVWRALRIAVYLLAVRRATIREIESRSRKNRINFNFGLLKLGHDLGDLQLQQDALAQLRGTLIAIPYRKGWFHPSEGRDGWIGIINRAVAEQVHKHADLGLPETLERMCENGFAYIHGAVEDRLTDEVRRLARRPREIQADNNYAFNDAPVNHDDRLQRDAIIRLARALADSNDCATVQNVLRIVEELLANPELLGKLSARQIRALAVNELAESRGVSKQQARAYVREFEGLAHTEESVRQLAEEIRWLARRDIPLRFRFVEMPRADVEGEGHEGDSEG